MKQKYNEKQAHLILYFKGTYSKIFELNMEKNMEACDDTLITSFINCYQFF